MFFYPLAGLPSSALTISRALCDGFGAPIKFLARTSWACGALRVPGYHANSFNRQNRFYVFPRALFFPSKSTYLLHFSWTPRLLLSTGTGLQVIRLPLLCSVIWSLGQTTFIPVELVCFISVASVPPLLWTWIRNEADELSLIEKSLGTQIRSLKTSRFFSSL